MKSCLTCKKEFEPVKTNLKKRGCNFCSLPCYWESLRLPKLTKKCIVCNKDYIQKDTIATKGFLKSKYCSLKCAAQVRPIRSGKDANNYKGGVSKDFGRYSNDRRLRILMVGGKHTPEEWQKLKEKYNYMCLCCKRYEPQIKLTRDHIMPITKGGSNHISNIQPLCHSCNSRKHTQSIDFISLYQLKEILC